MKKTKPKPLLFVFIFILIVGFGCFFGWNYFTGPVDKNNSQEIEVEIPAGTNSREIGKILTEKKLKIKLEDFLGNKEEFVKKIGIN